MISSSREVQQTSIMAFRDIEDQLGPRELEVYHAFQELCRLHYDATDGEVAAHLGQSNNRNYVSPRRFELVKGHTPPFLVQSQKRVCAISGKVCIAWKVSR